MILLHGLVRTSRSMRPLAVLLAQCGYLVANVGYPSRSDTIEQLARAVIPPAIVKLRDQGAGILHFVAHSMGGILLRAYLAESAPAGLGRAVLLSPPNQGSELVDRFGSLAWFRWLFGPAGCQLGTAPSLLPSRLGSAPLPLGIITGNRPAIGLAQFFTGPSDGKVAVTRARLEGMADFLEVPYGHSLIMYHRPVQEQVAHFLEHGCFRR